MRVLFVCPFVPWPLVTGGKIRTFNLIRTAAAHAEIHLRVVREPDTDDAAVRAALEPHCASVEIFDRERPGSLARVLRPKLERWFHSAAMIAEVRREVAQTPPHLIHLDELLLARVLPPGGHVPVVQHHHKLDTVLYGALSGEGGPARQFDLWKLRRLERESARRYRHHLFCSQEDAELMRSRHGALDCAVVPSGFDPALFAPAPHHERQRARLVFLGSMDYGPNVEAAQRFVRGTLPSIRARFPDVQFQIVGGNPTPEVRALADDGVEVTGRVEDVRPYLAAATCLVVPLAIGGGTRLKIVEALGMGTPVVSTRIGAEGLGLVHGRDLLLAEDVEGLAGPLLRLLADPDEGRELGERGHRTVHERFRWESLAEELLDYWERVAISGKPAPSR